MKIFLKIFGGIILLLIIAIIALPIFFKDDLVRIAKKETNKALNAEVDFGDFSLSLIKSFPDLHLSMNDVSISGKDEFEGVDLAKIKAVYFVVDLMSVIKGENIEVKQIQLDEPVIYAQVLKNGKANWDIVKESDADTTSMNDSASFEMQLNNIVVNEGTIIYDDASIPMFLTMDGTNLALEGNMNEAITSIQTKGSIEKLNMDFDGINYIKEARLTLDANLEADMENMKFSFNENELNLNQLPISFDGWIAMPTDDIDMDLNFSSRNTDFKTILSLVPASFSKDLEGVKTEGEVSLAGFAKGLYTDSLYPAFGLDLQIDNAMFQYPDLPASVRDIQMTANINSPGSDLNDMQIIVSQFHMLMADNPFDMTLLLSNPMEDPHMKASAKGTLLLSNIKNVVPLDEGEKMEGTFIADFNVDGKLSSLENENYEQFKASGILNASNFHYSSDSLDYPVDIKRADLKFNNQYAELSNLDMKVGKSDIRGNGRVENFIPYAMTDNGVLKGNLNLYSNLIDANELMGVDPNTSEELPDDDTPMEVVSIPGNLDLKLSADIKQLIYDNLKIDNVKGNVNVKDKKAVLQNSSLQMLGGVMALNGFYETTDSLKPTFDFFMDVTDFDIVETANKFVSIEKIAPIIKKAVGKYSTKFNLNGAFDNHMNPVYPSLFGEGNVFTKNVEIRDFKALEKIGMAFKSNTLQNPALKDLSMALKIADGKLWVEPFTNKIGDIKMTVAGSNSFDQSIDYVLSFQIPREELGSAANTAADNIFSQARDKGLNLELAEYVYVDARISGDFSNPNVKIDLKETVSNITDDLKEQAKDAIEQKKEELKQQAQDEIEEKRAEAEEKLRLEAEKQRKEAEEKAKDQLKDHTKKKLDDLFSR